MMRFAVAAFLVLVALALAVASRGGSGRAQDLLPTPKGQLGGAPAAPSAAIPVTPPAPPLATIPIVLEPAPTPSAPPVIATRPTASRSVTATPSAGSTHSISRAARSVVTLVAKNSTPAAGVVVADGRHVVTALDAVASGRDVEIIDAEGRRAPASVIGVDPASGLAVLALTGESAPALSFARVSPAVGDPVIAIDGAGNSEQPISRGVVTSTDVWFPAGPPAAVLIEAALKGGPAATGGALIDAAGNLAGVSIDDRLAGAVAAAGATTPLANSVRYAVPASIVARVVDDLIRLGHVDYPYLGAIVEPTTDDIAGPARVLDVIPNGPAARAGLRTGDVLLALDGRRFGPAAPASVALLAHEPGDRVRLEIRRDGVEQTVDVTLGARPMP